MTGTLLSICTGARKGHSKAPVERARVIKGHGIEGAAVGVFEAVPRETRVMPTTAGAA